jgi:hypothetical protein
MTRTTARGPGQVLYGRFLAGDPYRNLSSRYLTYDSSRAVALVQSLLEHEGVRLPRADEVA